MRDQIVEIARSYIGVPWVHEGRSRGGVDCIGLICQVATELGIDFEDKRGYSRTPVGHAFLEHMLKYLTVNRSGLLLPGSVAVIRQSLYPCHVGIFAEKDGRTTLIHAHMPRHCVVEEAWEPTERFSLIMSLDYPERSST